MKSTKINLLKIASLVLFSPLLQAESEINILPIDVTGAAINEQSYISGDYISNELIRFNSIKSNNSGALLDYLMTVLK